MNTLSKSACVALLAAVGCGSAAAQDTPAPKPAEDRAAATEGPSNPALRDELLRMVTVDQWYRTRIVQQSDDGLPVPSVLHEDMRAADRANTERVAAIIREHGWPGKSMVGSDGARAAFLLVQHANLDVQKEMIGRLEAAVKAGEAEGMHLAYLTDRVRAFQGMKQVYGTQMSTGAGGKPEPLNGLEDPENVDKRRAEVGLGPLADYMRGFDESPSAVTNTGPAPKITNLKDLPPGVVVKPIDGKTIPPGAKVKVVPAGGGKPIDLGAAPAVADEKVSDPELRDALLTEPTMRVAKPEERPAGAPPGETVMLAGEDNRLERIQAIAKERGWPGFEMVGRAASTRAFNVVVRRAKPEQIKELLPALKAAADAGQAHKAQAAYLEDLARVKEGRPQLYGTQVRRAESGAIELAPVEDPEKLDERRAAVGLPPAAEFLGSLRPPQ